MRGQQPGPAAVSPSVFHLTEEEEYGCSFTPTLLAPALPCPLRGLEISVKTLGPAYRIVCRDAADRQPDARRASSMERAAAEAGAGVGGAGRVLAVTSGFLVPPPLGLMHCDTLQVCHAGSLSSWQRCRAARRRLCLCQDLPGSCLA